MTNLVRMTGIEKRFPGVHALKNVSFDLNSGEVHALMGENGAGKSTLMKILSGIYPRDGGELLVNGQAVEIDGPRAAQALGIGIIHQELSLMNDLTVAQNIFIGREPRKRYGRLDETALNARALKLADERNKKEARLFAALPAPETEAQRARSPRPGRGTIGRVADAGRGSCWASVTIGPARTRG